MRRHANAVAAVAALAILDALRRKDLYVMAILCGLMIAAGRVFSLVGVWGLETFVKDVTFTSVSLGSVLLCILLAVRQVPEEISRRTLYPLLARPIGRGELLLGKFMGTVAMSWVALRRRRSAEAGASGRTYGRNFMRHDDRRQMPATMPY